MNFDLDLKALFIEAGVPSAHVFRTTKANLPTDPEHPAFISMVETGGLAPTTTHDDQAYRRPAMQIVARHRTSSAAKELAYVAYNACFAVRNRMINGTRYLNIAPQQEPFDLDSDEANRARWAFNVIGWKAG